MSGKSVAKQSMDLGRRRKRLRGLRPDIVIVDISTPGMDGLQAARMIRGGLPQSKVLIIRQSDPGIARVQATDVDAASYVATSDLTRE
jgi:DNA-binding NarL/FixJ family response regulator